MTGDIKCLLGEIIDAAKNYVDANWSNTHFIQPEIIVNPYLAAVVEQECVTKFREGLRQAGGQQAKKHFGWHGTKTIDAFVNICRCGWDPRLRKGQSCGPGEYFAHHNDTSLGYASTTGLVLLACILEGPWLTNCSHLVVGNPLDGNVAYQLPVLVVKYNKKSSSPEFPM
eukprot:TRINITY_DN484_c0_g1_i12.p1 TRINITY_DN484_c0_g1~~TRINITY_DN484_c0_g1_i12.p1  ORF type:complete len:170 (+),score=15.75 TRINITY_DN484_c0_g1_i12:39-548(+)